MGKGRVFRPLPAFGISGRLIPYFMPKVIVMRNSKILPYAFAVAGTPLLAQTAQDMVFAPDPPCYSRSYDKAHLAAHPDQQVTLMVVRADTEDMALDNTDQLLVLVDVLTRSGTSPYSGIGYCTPGKQGLSCLMEGDAGGFTLDAQDARLLLSVGENGLSFEGDADFLALEHDSGDDRSFLLDAGICG